MVFSLRSLLSRLQARPARPARSLQSPHHPDRQSARASGGLTERFRLSVSARSLASGQVPAQNRRPPALRSPLMSSRLRPETLCASSASIYNQQTASKHGLQRFTSKSRPDMRVGVEDPTQHMSAASQTARDPAGPYPCRAHSVCQTGSMGAATQTESKSRRGRHVTCPRQCFCLPLPQAQAFFADHIKVPVEPPGGVRRLESKDPRTAVREVPPATSRAAMA